MPPTVPLCTIIAGYTLLTALQDWRCLQHSPQALKVFWALQALQLHMSSTAQAEQFFKLYYSLFLSLSFHSILLLSGTLDCLSSLHITILKKLLKLKSSVSDLPQEK